MVPVSAVQSLSTLCGWLVQLQVGQVEQAVERGDLVVHLAAQTVVLLGHEVLQLLLSLLPVTHTAVQGWDVESKHHLYGAPRSLYL